MQCGFCEKSIPAGLTICPYCGHLQKTPAENRKQLWSMLFVVVAAFALLIAWRHLFPRP
jgi:predicted nucleic acid-binding Zn ribbon protein